MKQTYSYEHENVGLSFEDTAYFTLAATVIYFAPQVHWLEVLHLLFPTRHTQPFIIHAIVVVLGSRKYYIKK